MVDAVERVILTAVPVVEKQGAEDVVVGYTHKTGAIHALLSAVRECGSSVSFPASHALTSVEECATDTGFRCEFCGGPARISSGGFWMCLPRYQGTPCAIRREVRP